MWISKLLGLMIRDNQIRFYPIMVEKIFSTIITSQMINNNTKAIIEVDLLKLKLQNDLIMYQILKFFSFSNQVSFSFPNQNLRRSKS